MGFDFDFSLIYNCEFYKIEMKINNIILSCLLQLASTTTKFSKKKKSVDISVPVFYISVYLCIFSGEISKCRDINFQKNKILLLSSRNFRPKQSPFDATNWHLTVKHFFFFFFPHTYFGIFKMFYFSFYFIL